MNFIRQTKIIVRSFSSVPISKLILENLNQRSLLRVEGLEVIPFLQGLVTNDINHLLKTEGTKGIYSMFLNKPGKILYDSIIYGTENENCFLIECDQTIVNDLKKHMQMFRVRKKIEIENIDEEKSVWVVFNPDLTKDNLNIKIPEGIDFISCQDPRLRNLGTRIVVPKNYSSEEITKILVNAKVDEKIQHKEIRFHFGVAEGISELPPGKCYPLESNADFMHGVSFHKGCYLGQEFTARTHHTGVIRKRIMPLQFDGEINYSENLDIESDENPKIGKLRGVCGNKGIGLLRIEQALKADSLKINNILCKTKRPDWWPQEAPNIKEK